MASEPVHRITVLEYLAAERRAETKSDYFAGEVFAMSGASRDHNRMVVNISARLHTQTDGGACETYAADMRVRTPTDLLTYPDVLVACGEQRFADDEFDTLLNPTLVIEVLSPSTESYDRGVKLPNYRTIPELAEILYFAQDRCLVEHWTRQDGEEWRVKITQDPKAIIDLPSIGCSLPLAVAYRRVLA